MGDDARWSRAASTHQDIDREDGDYTLRAGLFESKGGVGVDWSFIDDRLRFTLEAYNWGREVKPPLVRFEGRYYVTKNVYAFGGWNDPPLSQQSSALIGAGVTWRDEDLKYLVPGAAGSQK